MHSGVLHNATAFGGLAARWEISSGMLIEIDQGRANPSIAILCRVAAGLGLSVPALLQPYTAAKRQRRMFQPQMSRSLWTGRRGEDACLIIGSTGPDMLELWSSTLHPRDRFETLPHPAGTQELQQIEEGSLSRDVEGVSDMPSQGGSAHALTDRSHAYVLRRTGSNTIHDGRG